MASLLFDLDATSFRRWVWIFANLFRIRTVPVSPAGPLPGLHPPREIFCSGFEFLLSVGQACSAPHTSFALSNLFGLLKYAHLIAPDHSLVLDRAAENLDTRKKRVLSDDFGCGMALLVGRHCLGADYFLDFETALSQGLMSTQAPILKRPDFLALLPGADYALIEAKGSQQGASYVRRTQIPAGCKQVQAVRLYNNQGPTPSIKCRLVVGLAIGQEATPTKPSQVLLGDPSENEPYAYHLTTPFFEDIAVRVHFARTAALIGDYALQRNLLNPTATSSEPSEGRARSIDGRRYLGSEVRLRSKEQEAGFFIGLDSELRNGLMSTSEIRARAIESAKARLDSLPLQTTEEFRHIARRRDGAVIEAWIPREATSSLVDEGGPL